MIRYVRITQFKLKNYKKSEFCKFGSREMCQNKRRERGLPACSDFHYKRLIHPHTDENLGNCSYLDTCRHMDYCKYIHYKIDEEDEKINKPIEDQLTDEVRKRPKQWINCDLRNFDFTVLGECNVIMLDPPWDIHMSVEFSKSVTIRHT